MVDCDSEEHEASRVVARIQSLRAEGSLQAAGGQYREWKDFCVLYRANHMAKPFEKALFNPRVSRVLRHSLDNGRGALHSCRSKLLAAARQETQDAFWRQLNVTELEPESQNDAGNRNVDDVVRNLNEPDLETLPGK